jgi:hypothetical protein
MNPPIVDLAFWNPGTAGTPAVDALVQSGHAPLAKHGLTALAMAYAAERGIEPHPAQRRWADQVAAKSLAADGALGEVTEALRAAAIPFFVAKGPSAAYRLEADPQLRAYTDLDVYVGAHDLTAARHRLAAIGYRPVGQKPGPLGGPPRELHGGSFDAVVEVHADPVDNLHRRWLTPITEYQPWMLEVDLCGTRVPVLAPAVELCLQAIHLGAGHRYAKLGCYRDIAHLATHFEPGTADRFGASTYLSVIFAVLAAFGQPAPATPASRRTSRLVAALAGSDPATWDEYRPTRTNLLALVSQRTGGHSLAAALTATRAIVPMPGRRVSFI